LNFQESLVKYARAYITRQISSVYIEKSV